MLSPAAAHSAAPNVLQMQVTKSPQSHHSTNVAGAGLEAADDEPGETTGLQAGEEASAAGDDEP